MTRRKSFCNRTILADAAFEASREKMQEWKATSTVDLSFHEILMDEITTSVQQRGIKATISNAKTEQKDKANDVKQKRQACTIAKKNNQRI